METILTIYVIPIIGAALGVLCWRLYFRGRKPLASKGAVEGKKEGNGEAEESIKARIYDCSRQTISSQDISIETANKIKGKGGSLGRQYTRSGEKVYELQLKDGEYSPAPVGVSEVIVSPREIAEDLAIGYSIALYYRPQLPQGAGGNIKQILWWTGIIAVIVFLAVVD